MGQAVPSIYINAKTARICPECILENGYISQFWYLRHAVACPLHARIAINTCPDCGRELSWCRPGLLTCACGHDLSKGRGGQIQDSSVLTMLKLLDAKLRGSLSSNPDFHGHGFPLQELESLSLSTFLGIIYRVQPKKPTRRCKHKVTAPIDANNSPQALITGLKIAYSMLSSWPYGFYDYLDSLPEHKVYSESYSLHRQFQSFYSSFFRSGLPEADTDFLRKAFVSFGNERRRGKGFIDPRIAKRAKTERDLVGIAGLAKYLCVMPPTVMKYVRDGLIKGEPLRSGKRVRKIFDLEKVPFLPSSGKYYIQREAAMFLGVPVSLLQKLKADKTYVIRRLAMGLGGYDELDLIEFRDAIVSKAPWNSDYDSAVHISIGQLLRKKLGGPDIVAAVILTLLNGTLQPCGRMGNAIRDIYFMRGDLLQIGNMQVAA